MSERVPLSTAFLALTGRQCPACRPYLAAYTAPLPEPTPACLAYHLETQRLEDEFLLRLDDLERQLALHQQLVYELKKPKPMRIAR